MSMHFPFPSSRLVATLSRGPVSSTWRAISFSHPIQKEQDPFDRPGPPPLPPRQQREFEELFKQVNTPLASSSSSEPNPQVSGDQEHPDIRRKPAPEFEGDVNPKTGEVNGPKREPVKYNEWGYGGRVTDF